MVFGKQIQYWPQEDLKSFADIEKDIIDLKKCNQQTKNLRLALEERKKKDNDVSVDGKEERFYSGGS